MPKTENNPQEGAVWVDGQKVHKVGFLIGNALRGFLSPQRRRLNLQMILCTAAALLLPCMALAYFRGVAQDRDLLKLRDEANVFVASGTLYCRQGEAEALFSPLPVAESEAVYGAQVLFDGNAKKVVTGYASGISEHFENFVPFELLEGRMLTAQEFADGAPVALVSDDFFRFKGIARAQTPFFLSVDGQSIEVVGILRCPSYTVGFLVPAKRLQTFTNGGDGKVDTLYARFAQPTSENNVRKELAQNGIDTQEVRVKTASAVYAEMVRSTGISASIIFAVGLLALLFSAVNLTLIVAGKLTNAKKVIAVKLAVGAARADVMGETALENIVMGSVGTVLAAVTVKFMTESITVLGSLALDTAVILQAWLLCTAMLCLVSMLAVHLVTGREIRQLMM